MAVFRFRFASFHFEPKMMAVFCFRFASFRFEAKMIAVFRFFFVLFFALFHFRFASDFYVSHRCETSEKSTFFASKRKKFCFRFASFRFEAKMTAHPIPHVPNIQLINPEHGHLHSVRIFITQEFLCRAPDVSSTDIADSLLNTYEEPP